MITATAITNGGTMNITARTARSLTVGLGAAFAAGAALTAAAIPASASAHPARCRTGQLAIVLTHPVAQGGNQGWTVELEDKGTASCTVTDYPRLGLEGRRGQRLRSTVSDGSTYFHRSPAPSTVTLAPGGFAVAYLAYGTVAGPGSVRADAVTVRAEGAAAHKTDVLPRAVVVTRRVLDVTAWAARKA